MTVSPIKKMNMKISILASAYQKLNEICDFADDLVLIGSFPTVYKSTISIDDFFIPTQEMKYASLELIKEEFLKDFDSETNDKFAYIPAIGLKPSKSGNYCNVSNIKRFLYDHFTRFLMFEVKKTSTIFTYYDYEENLSYEDVDYFIDVCEFEQGTEYLKPIFEERFKRVWTYPATGYGNPSYGSTYDQTSLIRTKRAECKDARINIDNPKIETLVHKELGKVNLVGFQYILQATQTNLMTYLTTSLEGFYKKQNIVTTFDYVYCKGELPILLVCHLDTKHAAIPEKIFIDSENKTLWCPNGIGGDDRCGVYAALNVISYIGKGKKMPYILFTTDEEIGCYGAKQAAKDLKEDCKYFKYLLEMDRHGGTEVVFYNTTDEKFQKYIIDFGFTKEKGMSSDIVYLTERWKVPSANISIGYYNEHTFQEYINYEELGKSIEKVVRMVACSEQAPWFINK